MAESQPEVDGGKTRFQMSLPISEPNPGTGGEAVEEYWTNVEAAYERLQRDDPTGWAEYLDELAEWDAGTADADTAAAEEWPEYNR